MISNGNTNEISTLYFWGLGVGRWGRTKEVGKYQLISKGYKNQTNYQKRLLKRAYRKKKEKKKKGSTAEGFVGLKCLVILLKQASKVLKVHY